MLNIVKSGVKSIKNAIISTPEKKRGNGEKKNLKFHVFFAKHSFHILRFLDFEIFRFLDFYIFIF